MNPQDDLRAWFLNIVSSNTFQQIAPLVVLIVVPTLGFLAASTIRNLFSALASTIMSFSLPSWLSWSSSSNNHSTERHSNNGRDKKKSKKLVRTRKDQMEMKTMNGSAKAGQDGYYPGLVNVSGTYCFMNSTLQALASLSYLQPHIEAVHAKAEALDVPTPVIDALKDLLHDLNTPRSSYHSIRPLEIIQVLSAQTQGRSNSLFYSREHQDAQELFQLISECLKNEITAVDKEGTRDRGFGGLAALNATTTTDIGKSTTSLSVFDGLTANRRSCVVCGYTEAVMHFSFDTWQLSVPRLAGACRLEDCLDDYTRLEMLRDCICRKCSVLATQTRIRRDLASLQESAASVSPSSPTTTPTSPSPSHKKRRLKKQKHQQRKLTSTLTDLQDALTHVTSLLTQGRIEDPLPPSIPLEKVFSPASTKQAMIARPPPVLALHLNRSMHHGGAYGASKNGCRVMFPEVLDLTPYTTSGSLSIVPTVAMSTPSPAPTHVPLPQFQPLSGKGGSGPSPSPPPPPPTTTMRRSTTPTPGLYEQRRMRTVYRLSAVVCHFGSHSFGHYICYRRKPRGDGVWRPPKLVDPEVDDENEDGTEEDGGEERVERSECDGRGMGRSEYLWEDGEPPRGRGWLRISDDSVRECGIESVLAEGSGAFMLYYELATWDRPRAGVELGAVGAGVANRESSVSMMGASEETLKPEVKALYLNGSVGSLVSEVGVGVQVSSKVKEEQQQQQQLNLSLSIPPRSLNKSMSASDFESGVGRGLSASLPSTSASAMFGPRVVRSVTAGRSRSPSVQPGSSFGSASDTASRASSVVIGESKEETLVAPSSSDAPTVASSSTSEPSSATVDDSITNGHAASKSSVSPASNPNSPSLSPSKKKGKNKKKQATSVGGAQSSVNVQPSSALPPKAPLASSQSNPRILV